MDIIRVDGANGICFSTRKIFSAGSGLPFNGTFTTSSTSVSESLRIPKQTINPNKAVFTIDSKTSNILIVNNKACQLLDYRPSELCDMKFSSLLTNRTNKSYVSALAEGQLREDGTMVLLSGKVVEMISKNGSKVAVSLWIRQIDVDGRCLAVAEPVERRIAKITVAPSGKIVSSDTETLMLFQIDNEDDLHGSDIRHLIPAIQLPNVDNIPNPKYMYKQKATGRLKDNLSFPLCLMITSQNDTDIAGQDIDATADLYVITIWVFQNISGLIVIDENGSIELCNHHFSMLMFGYSQSKITRLHITHLIPNFAEEFEYLGTGEWNYNSRSRNITYSSLDNESETETDNYYEAESFYATPVGLTASDRSKSINDNEHSFYETIPPDMSKAISEPIQIYLDSIMTDSFKSLRMNENDTDGKTNVASNSDIVFKSSSFCKSFSDNMLGKESTQNINSRNEMSYPSQLESSKPANELNEVTNPVERDDDTRNCDASELLTPVNEPNLADKYVLELEKSNNILYCNEISSDNDTSHNVPAQRNQSAQRASKSNVRRISTQPNTFPDGKYEGKAIHCDGNIFNILYTISSQELPCGRKVFCVWICRRDECDLDDEEDDGKHPNLTLTFNSITSNVETSIEGAPGTTKRNSMNVNANQSSRPNSVSLLSQHEDEQVSGEYNKYYTSLKQIGKGAFGYVKLSFRHSDRLLVVTKFILKEKLPPQFMVIADDKKEIPMEVYLLSTLKHPNIVTVLDVFENEKFFQLVMEKHGSGMDLFEFIDRRPLMDEQLGSFIFRQIVNAIDYLHSLKILHRDIKDENIIIDQYFHVKLIDFGSATFMEEGKMFSTFYGTTEYCSPEVLAGNKYAGPELEIWALGITLFVLIFFENPFIDIEETLHSELHLPHTVSQPLEKTLTSMLDKNPRTRCTMKQLVTDSWITQEIPSTCNFNFSWIVPCENHESNPEKHFNGQIYSSATGLSTTSPTSLADEDSIIDDDIEDEELCEETCSLSHLNQEFDYRKYRKSNEECMDVLDTTIINATTSSGKQPTITTSQKSVLPIVKYKYNCNRTSKESELVKRECNCNSMRNRLSDSVYKCIHNEICSCDSMGDRGSPNLLGANSTIPMNVSNGSPILSLSKSETNISGANVENPIAVYNVVSLNNLHDKETFFDRGLGNHSTNQCANNSSKNGMLLGNSGKKHGITQTSPNVLNTVTVSMRREADVSDNMFLN